MRYPQPTTRKPQPTTLRHTAQPPDWRFSPGLQVRSAPLEAQSVFAICAVAAAAEAEVEDVVPGCVAPSPLEAAAAAVLDDVAVRLGYLSRFALMDYHIAYLSHAWLRSGRAFRHMLPVCRLLANSAEVAADPGGDGHALGVAYRWHRPHRSYVRGPPFMSADPLLCPVAASACPRRLLPRSRRRALSRSRYLLPFLLQPTPGGRTAADCKAASEEFANRTLGAPPLPAAPREPARAGRPQPAGCAPAQRTGV